MLTKDKITLNYLGPKGSFSEMAAKIASTKLPCTLTPKPNFETIGKSINTTTLGIIPYYNFLEGLVQEGLDQIYENNLKIIGAIRLPIRLAIGSSDGNISGKNITSHPKALAQCSNWIKINAPLAKLIVKSSTSEAASSASNDASAAIAHIDTLTASGLKLHSLDIGNKKFDQVNFTDFLIVSSQEAEVVTKFNDSNRTLVIITPQFDQPGLLSDILSQFSFVGINLAKIHSRPATALIGDTLEAQMFYMELVSKPDNPNLIQCIQSLISKFGMEAVRVLGSWEELPQPLPESPTKQFEGLNNCLVIGSSGGFGSSIINILKNAGMTVSGVDINKPQSNQIAKLDKFWQSSIIPKEALVGVKWIIFCTSEAVVLSNIDRLTTIDNSIVVSDIASVKSNIAFAVERYLPTISWVSLHPMFASSAEFKGRNICITPMTLAAQNKVAIIKAFIETTGAKVTTISPSEHDLVTAKLQAATHLLLLGFGNLVTDTDVDQNLHLTTPINDNILAMLSRMLVANPELYHGIQTENPFAKDARLAIIKNLTHINEGFASGEAKITNALFLKLRNAFGGNLASFVLLSEKLIKIQKQQTQNHD